MLRFLGWVPSPCWIRITNPSRGNGWALRHLAAHRENGGWRRPCGVPHVRDGAFCGQHRSRRANECGTVPFFAAGKFGQPSSSNGDVAIEARFGVTLLASVPVMVLIRKSANNLSTAERDSFVTAFAKLSDQGQGRFKDFRDMHVRVSLSQAHGALGILPWHRAYLLDLERDLLALDPSVSALRPARTEYLYARFFRRRS
jgi:tyrosinase